MQNYSFFAFEFLNHEPKKAVPLKSYLIETNSFNQLVRISLEFHKRNDNKKCEWNANAEKYKSRGELFHENVSGILLTNSPPTWNFLRKTNQSNQDAGGEFMRWRVPSFNH